MRGSTIGVALNLRGGFDSLGDGYELWGVYSNEMLWFQLMCLSTKLTWGVLILSLAVRWIGFWNTKISEKFLVSVNAYKPSQEKDYWAASSILNAICVTSCIKLGRYDQTMCPSQKECQQETPEAISLTIGLVKQWAPGIKEAEMKDYLA